MGHASTALMATGQESHFIGRVNEETYRDFQIAKEREGKWRWAEKIFARIWNMLELFGLDPGST